MKKILSAVILLGLIMLGLIFLTSCTENSRVKKFGGTGTINLPANQKLITATWKGDNVWYLTRPMRQGEAPETYEFKEESSFGLIEGTYLIVESK
jgi:hypothetical protein